jgi:uncharacterized protein
MQKGRFMSDERERKALYSVQLAGMSTETYTFQFQVDDALMKKYENEEIKAIKAEATVELTHRPNVTEADIELVGEVSTHCDRCLSLVTFPINLKERAIVKQATKNPENEINIIIFDPDKGQIEFDQYLYDMIVTALPIQRVHEHEEDCDAEMMDQLEQNDDQSDEIDPRWNDLKNLI